MRDQMERIIAGALRSAGIDYITDREPESPAKLDFYLPEYDLHIEVKRYHSDRISEQMSRAENVIAVQGEAAVKCLATWIARGQKRSPTRSMPARPLP